RAGPRTPPTPPSDSPVTDAADLDVELLARLAHEQYVEHVRASGGPGNERSLVRWKELSATLRGANRGPGRHTPVKLAAVGCRLERGAPREPFVFADDEMET